VSADTHDTLLDMRIGAPFAWLKEEVNATFWPNHATIALREHSWAACPVPKPLKRIIETVEIVEPTHALPPSTSSE
jgi:hypothetical protein